MPIRGTALKRIRDAQNREVIDKSCRAAEMCGTEVLCVEVIRYEMETQGFAKKWKRKDSLRNG